MSALFPGGSITGAPKIRSTEIISELESFPRSLYTGTIGYIGFNSVADFNIAIRTVVATQNRLSFNVGGGIVSDSKVFSEWNETQIKGEGIKRALSQFG